MERRYSGVFWKIYDAARRRPRVISNRGGTRSGKTYSTLQFLHELIARADGPGDVTSVVSETMPHLKRGAIRDFEDNLGRPLTGDPRWNATDCIYTYPNGAKLEFFSADNPAKVQGPARKRLFVNECNHVGWDTYRQLAVRTQGIILLDYNPAAPFWAMDKVECRDNCVLIRSTYLDNLDFLTPAQVEEIEANKGDERWWRVYGLGEVGTLEGAILDFETVDALPDGPEASSLAEAWGIDFGFTNDPTAVVRVLADTRRKHLYVRQLCYRRRMTNADIAALLKAEGATRTTEVYADCAEPKSIAEISAEGLNVLPCDKDAPVRSRKLLFQLQWLRGWRLLVTKDSLDLIRELRNYVWAKDRDGNDLNEPIDAWNHAIDAMRYAAYSKLARREGYGEYHITAGRNIHTK